MSLTTHPRQQSESDAVSQASTQRVLEKMIDRLEGQIESLRATLTDLKREATTADADQRKRINARASIINHRINKKRRRKLAFQNRLT